MPATACPVSCLQEQLFDYASTRTAFPEDAEDAASEAVASLLASNRLQLELGKHIVRCQLQRAAEHRARTQCVGTSGNLLPIGLLTQDQPHRFRADVWKELGRIIEEAQLPPVQRQVLLMRRDGWTVKEIARELVISPRAVQYAVAAGIRSIQERNPSFERLFYLMSRVSLRHSVSSVSAMMRLHLHRNPRNEG